MRIKHRAGFSQTYRDVVSGAEPHAGLYGGVLGAGLHPPAHLEGTGGAPRVAAQQRVAQGALARPGGAEQDEPGVGEVRGHRALAQDQA